MTAHKIFSAMLALGVVAGGGAAFGGTKLVSVGDIAATAPRAQEKLYVVRAAVEREVEAIDWRASTKMKRYVVSVAITNLRTETTQGRVATTCELSTTVRGAKDGKLVVVLNQRARAESDQKGASLMEDGAIRAAATSAIRDIPRALMQSPR